MESLVPGSGFESAVFEPELCTSGSLHGVLAGSHYNRAWLIHATFVEALEYLLLTRFLVTVKLRIPGSPKLSSLIDSIPPDLTTDETFRKSYEQFRESARKGDLGKTAQFWFLYMDLIKYQIMSHTAIQENDLLILFHCWKTILPMYFMMNKVNHARYNPDSSPFFAMISSENSKCMS